MGYTCYRDLYHFQVITAYSQVRLHEAFKSELLIDAFHDAQK